MVRLVPHKIGLAIKVQALAIVHLKAGVILRALTLSGHRRLISLQIQAQPTLPCDIVGEINRKSVGVVQLENHVAGNGLIGNLLQRLLENRHAVVQCSRKLLFFALQSSGNRGLLRYQLRIRLTHLSNQIGN